MDQDENNAVQIVQHEPAATQTSTDQIRATTDRIRGIGPPKLKPEAEADENKLDRQ